MIYLSKNNSTEVITDNVADFIPESFEVYLDDVLIGEFDNLYPNGQYLMFNCPKLKLEEKEYTMKIYTYGFLIKEELVIVKDLSKLQVKSITKPKTLKMYERE